MIDSPDIISLDTETFFSSKLKYSVRTMLPEEYASHPLFDCFIVSICNGPVAWAGHPTELDWSTLEGATLLSQNARFDQAIVAEMIKRGIIPKFTFKDWHCTANLSSYLWNRRSLAAAVEHAFGVEVSKESRDTSDNKHWPQDFTEKERADFLEYARKDAVWCRRLFIEFGDQWSEKERFISDWTIRRGREGIQIDRALLDQFILQTFAAKAKIQSTLPWLDDSWDEDDEFNNPKPTSTKCIAEQCRRSDIPCPPVKAHEGEEAFEEWEVQYGHQHPWISQLSCWRSVNKLLKTFELMKTRLRSDGTMPFGQKYCGTTTGRVAGDGKVNLFNQRKEALLIKQDGFVETDDLKVDAAHKSKKKTGQWPEWVLHPIDFRNLIIPRPGKKMIVSDLSQIEPRVAAWLAGDWEFLRLVAGGMSPYQAHAVMTMGWPADKNLKTEDDNLYALAKARLLSLGYGAAWEKLIVMARTNAGLDLTVDDPEFVDVVDPRTGKIKQVSGYGTTSKKVVKDYRASNPLICQTWWSLDDALRSSLGGNFEMTLPVGRKLAYEGVRCEARIEKDKETGLPKKRTVFTASMGDHRRMYYGSKIFENACQAIARDVFYECVYSLEKAGHTVLIGVYDEAVTEVDAVTNPKSIQKHMIVTPDWMPGLPLNSETKEVPCYQK